jgi:hypothetical protein
MVIRVYLSPLSTLCTPGELALIWAISAYIYNNRSSVVSFALYSESAHPAISLTCANNSEAGDGREASEKASPRVLCGYTDVPLAALVAEASKADTLTPTDIQT